MIFGGIDIGGTTVKVGFVDKEGNILCRDLFHVENIKSYKNFLKRIFNSASSASKSVSRLNGIATGV